MFSKAEYKKNREAGKRGQGEYPVLEKIALWTEEDFKAGKCGKKQVGKERTSGVSMYMIKGKLTAVTRKMKRRKLVDHHQMKKGFEYGVKIGGKTHNKIKRAQKKYIGEQFGRLIVTEKDGKVVNKKYIFPAKSRHLRSETEEQRRHKDNAQLAHDNSDLRYGETNHQRHLRHRKEREDAKAASSTAPAAV